MSDLALGKAPVVASEQLGVGSKLKEIRRKRRLQRQERTAIPPRLKGARIVRRYIYLVIVIILLLAPLVLPLLSAFKGPSEELFGSQATLFPQDWSIQAFYEIFQNTNVLNAIKNSLIVCAIAVTSHVILATTTGYMLSRRGWRGRGLGTAVVLVAMMFPFEAIMLSLYAVVADFNLLDSIVGIWIPGLLGPFQVLLMRTAFLGVPEEIEDAALIDGANEWQRFWNIFLPQVRGSITIVALTSFIAAWQDYLWPLLIINSNDKQTMMLSIAALQSSFGTDYRVVLAGAITAMIPILVVFFFSQKYFFRGIEDGGLKF